MGGSALSKSSRGSVPWGLIGMLVLVLAAERFVARHGDDLFLNLDSWSWREAGKAARREGARRPQVVCFGDSLVRWGVAPTVIEVRTGRRAYGFAVGGGQAPASYFLLRRVLQEGARPDAILVDFLPRLLELSPRHNTARWPLLLGLPECAELAWAARDSDLFAALGLGKLFPSYRLRHEVRDNLAAAVRDEYNPHSHHVPAHLRRNLDRNRGATLFPTPGRTYDLDDWCRTYFPPAWTCDPTNALYVRKFHELAAARHIPVFWLVVPVRPEIQRDAGRNGNDAKQARFVRETAGPFANVTVLDGRRAGYGPDLFCDPHHLNRSGAAVFTDDVAAVVSHALDGPRGASRWVELPRYRDRSVNPPLEDIEQSRLAVERLRARR